MPSFHLALASPSVASRTQPARHNLTDCHVPCRALQDLGFHRSGQARGNAFRAGVSLIAASSNQMLCSLHRRTELQDRFRPVWVLKVVPPAGPSCLLPCPRFNATAASAAGSKHSLPEGAHTPQGLAALGCAVTFGVQAHAMPVASSLASILSAPFLLCHSANSVLARSDCACLYVHNRSPCFSVSHSLPL